MVQAVMYLFHLVKYDKRYHLVILTRYFSDMDPKGTLQLHNGRGPSFVA